MSQAAGVVFHERKTSLRPGCPRDPLHARGADRLRVNWRERRRVQLESLHVEPPLSRGPHPDSSVRTAHVRATDNLIRLVSENVWIIVNAGPTAPKLPTMPVVSPELFKESRTTSPRTFLWPATPSAAPRRSSRPRTATPNVERMLRDAIRKRATVRLCTTCLDARGVPSDDLV